MKKIIFIVLLMLSSFSFSKNFFEKDKFFVNVTEISKKNRKNKIRNYEMEYDNGTLNIYIKSPEINKGEIYTFKKNEKIVYYPTLKQTVVQKIKKEEESLLNIINMLKKIEMYKNHNRNGNSFIFENNKLVEIKNNNYIINFNDYKNEKGYLYPSKIYLKSKGIQIDYELKDFK